MQEHHHWRFFMLWSSTLQRSTRGVPLLFFFLPLGLKAAAEAEGGEAVKVRRGHFRAAYEAEGVFVPAQATEMGFWPQAYEGELRVAEARPHGSSVKQGEVVLRLEDDKLKDMVRSAEWALRIAERNAADVKERYAEYEEDTKPDVGRAEKDLALARKSLKGYLEVNRALEKEEYELGERSQKHAIEDQEDELAQLGKMYKEDELTKETEEIVLKRAKRNLEESRKRLDVHQRQHSYGEEFSEPVRRESLENLVKDKAKALKDLKRARQSGGALGKVDLEKAEHEVLASRKRLERLEQDLEHFSFRAPHDGIVIHGGFEEKLAVNPLRKSSVVPPNQTIVTVAKPGALKARFLVKE